MAETFPLRSLFQRDLHLHEQQPTYHQRRQHSSEHSFKRQQRPGRQRQPVQQQSDQHRNQHDDQQQLGKAETKSAKDCPRIQRKADDVNL